MSFNSNIASSAGSAEAEQAGEEKLSGSGNIKKLSTGSTDRSKVQANVAAMTAVELQERL